MRIRTRCDGRVCDFNTGKTQRKAGSNDDSMSDICSENLRIPLARSDFEKSSAYRSTLRRCGHSWFQRAYFSFLQTIRPPTTLRIKPDDGQSLPRCKFRDNTFPIVLHHMTSGSDPYPPLRTISRRPC